MGKLVHFLMRINNPHFEISLRKIPNSRITCISHKISKTAIV